MMIIAKCIEDENLIKCFNMIDNILKPDLEELREMILKSSTPKIEQPDSPDKPGVDLNDNDKRQENERHD